MDTSIRMLHKFINEADVILIVLDARDPPGCPSRLVWKRKRSACAKRRASDSVFFLALNKIGCVSPINILSFHRSCHLYSNVDHDA